MTQTKPISTPVVADDGDLPEAIRKISQGFTKLKKQGLNRKAIVVLLHDASGVTKTNILKVLDGLADLEKNYCEKK